MVLEAFRHAHGRDGVPDGLTLGAAYLELFRLPESEARAAPPPSES